MRERPTLILLCGAPLDHSIVRPACDALADIAQVIYLDYRGNGRSPHDIAMDWPRRQLSDDVYGFCAALSITKPVVLGFSVGARVAMSCACDYPEHPGKLILLSGAANDDWSSSHDAFERLGGPEVRAASKAFRERPSDVTGAEFRRLCYPFFMRPATLQADAFARMRPNPAMWAHRTAAPGINDHRILLGSIRCPTLVMVGDEDPVTPLAQAQLIYDALPMAMRRLEVFPGCGHGLHLEDTERFLSVMHGFIGSGRE